MFDPQLLIEAERTLRELERDLQDRLPEMTAGRYIHLCTLDDRHSYV